MIDSLFGVQEAESFIPTIPSFIVVICVSLVLGLINSLVYLKTNQKTYSKNFAVTLVILPTILAIIFILVGNRIATAFSIVGVFSITRFRSAPGSAKDISYILFTMAIGLSCGLGEVFYAVIITLVLSAVMLILEFSKYASHKSISKVLRIKIPESLNYEDAFKSILDTYTYSYDLIRIKTAELGSIYELSYQVKLKQYLSEKDFLDELRCRNGNLTITLGVKESTGKF